MMYTLANIVVISIPRRITAMAITGRINGSDIFQKIAGQTGARVGIENQVFHQRVADSLLNAPLNLALSSILIYHLAKVVGIDAM